MAALLRLLCVIFVSKFTQDKLKEGQADSVKLPINESTVMKAHLAEWIREAVIKMNDKKSQSVVHCWEKTGLLAIWNVDERACMAPNPFAEVARLFPGHEKDDTSGAVNDIDIQEQFDDFSCRVATTVNKETGDVIRKETEEDTAIEDEVIAAVIDNAPASVEGQDKDADDEQEKEGQHRNNCIETSFC